MRRLGQFGQDSETEARASAFDLLARMRQTNNALIELENLVRQSPAAAREIGRELAQKRSQFSDLVSRFQYGYTLLFGEPAAGLSIGPAAIAIIAAIFAAIGTALYGITAWTIVALQRGRTAAAQTQQAGDFAAQASAKDAAANDAEARGDLATAARLRAERDQLLALITAGGGAPAQDMAQWFQENWGWLAAAVTGIVVLPRILE